jgi:hypothetical protein
MEIHDLTNSNGLVPLNLGPAKLIQTHANFLHIIKLDQYQQNIRNLDTSIKSLETVPFMEQSLNVTKLNLQLLQNKLQNLMPTFRYRRGLINGLGSVIKSITGNMDAYDAMKLNDEISSIIKNENQINSNIQKQHFLNKNMIERFENITDHINNQQILIIKHFNEYQDKLKNTIRSEDSRFKYLQFL